MNRVNIVLEILNILKRTLDKLYVLRNETLPGSDREPIDSAFAGIELEMEQQATALAEALRKPELVQLENNSEPA